MQTQKYRQACDSCHKRKTKCEVRAPGACQNCQDSGMSCVFNQRREMGRPRKTVLEPNAQRKGSVQPLPEPNQWPTQPETESSIPVSTYTSTQEPNAHATVGHVNADWLPWESEIDFTTNSNSALSDLYSIDCFLQDEMPNAVVQLSNKDQTPRQSEIHGHLHCDLIFLDDKGPVQEPISGPHTTVDFLDVRCLDHRKDSAKRISPTPTSCNQDYFTSRINGSNYAPALSVPPSVTVQRLSSILFGLQVDLSKLRPDTLHTPYHKERIFSKASELCDVVEVLLSLDRDYTQSSFAQSPMGTAEQTHVGRNTWLLSITAITMIIGVYQSMCIGMQNPMPQALQPTPPTDDMSAIPQLTAQRLEELIQLTMMHYHLMKLSRAFDVHTYQGEDGMVEAKQTMQDLRRAVDKLIFDWKSHS